MKRTFSIVFILFLMTGCDLTTQKEIDALAESEMEQEIQRFDGEKSVYLANLYTTNKEMALTFNGISNEQTMINLLDELDQFQITATFFFSGEEVSNHSEVVKEVVARGHEIENRVDRIKKKNYEEIYHTINTTNKRLNKEFGIKPNYVRTTSNQPDDDTQLITAQLGMEAVVGHSSYFTEEDLQKLDNKMDRYLTRGAIIAIEIDTPGIIESIEKLAQKSKKLGYAFVRLEDLIEHSDVRKPVEEIAGHDLIKVNLDYHNEEPNLLYSKDIQEKIVALTFDDWGSDRTILAVLDILEQYDIKSTFFLKAKGVEKNPNLARVFIEEGHEVASHTYSHKRSTEISPRQLQEDLVKAHQVITEAIQEEPQPFMRPPFGNIDEATAKVISAAGYKNIAMYDVSSYDWNADYTLDDVVNRVMDNVQPGSVIVMHISDDIHTLDALPIIIERLKANGYSFIKMSEWFDE